MDPGGHPLKPLPDRDTQKLKKTFSMGLTYDSGMFPRLAEHYRSVVQDLVMSLQALASLSLIHI